MTYLNNETILVSQTDMHSIVGINVRTLQLSGHLVGATDNAGSDYDGPNTDIRITSPSGNHYSKDLEKLYFTSLVHAGIFVSSFVTGQTYTWLDTVAQSSSLQFTSSEEHLLVGVDFGVMKINRNTEETQWITGSDTSGDAVDSPMTTEYGFVADFILLADDVVLITDKAQNR